MTAATDATHAAAGRPLALIVLAAGKGTRMRGDTPKVLHRLLGRTVLGWVLEAAAPLRPERTVVVVGHGADLVTASLPEGADTATQVDQLGSGDALRSALSKLNGFVGDVLVVNGDGALFTTATMRAVIDGHVAVDSVASALAIRSDDDLPYGRIISGADGVLDAIVEAVDADAAQLAVRDLNAGVYVFDAAFLADAAPRLTCDNHKGEYYITDLFAMARAGGLRTQAVVAGDPQELLGINDRRDLATAELVLRDRVINAHMANGVTFVLPHTSLVEPTVAIETDAVIEPGSILRGTTSIASGAVVGPYATLTDTRLDTGARVSRSEAIEAHVGVNASAGPFAYLRPGSVLREGAKAGTFVELKNSVLGPHAKVPHLSYVGDATIGAGTNIGAGTITANYRPELGRGKQRTTIGAGVRTGSNNVFVAPVTIGDDAFTAAGSTIVEDVPAGALAIARARQVVVQDYAQRLAAPSTPGNRSTPG